MLVTSDSARVTERTRCKKQSSKLVVSRSFVAIFEINSNIDRTRCKKQSSKLVVSRSFVAIFEVNLEYTLHSLKKILK